MLTITLNCETGTQRSANAAFVQRYASRLRWRLFFVLPATARATTIALGGISFNTLIPSGGGVQGVTDFELDNFSGIYALPPEFPAIGDVTFENSTLVLTKTGGVQDVISLGDLAPGANTPSVLSFSSQVDFVSATFTATLSAATFTLSDGTTFHASGNQISSEVTPSSGSTLSPDVDFSLITVAGTSGPTAVPEPRALFLELVALAGGAYGLRRRLNVRSANC